MEGEPAGWDGPITAGKAAAWCSYGPSVLLLPARAGVWVKTAPVCVPYIAVNNFYCHNDRSWDVREESSSPFGSVTSVHTDLFCGSTGSTRG